MTREEAIEILKNTAWLGTDKDREQTEEAVEMAISALEQNESAEKWYKLFVEKLDELEPCTDTVSRKLAIRAIKNLYPDIPRVDFNGAKRKWADKYAQYIECERLIEQLPPVTQKLGKCKNCKYFEYDRAARVHGIMLIVAHNNCNKWGNGCKTSEDGYCYLFEPQESEDKTE